MVGLTWVGVVGVSMSVSPADTADRIDVGQMERTARVVLEIIDAGAPPPSPD
jgi:hypothetical protein